MVRWHSGVEKGSWDSGTEDDEEDRRDSWLRSGREVETDDDDWMLKGSGDRGD